MQSKIQWHLLLAVTSLLQPKYSGISFGRSPPCYSQNTVEPPLGGPPCYSQNTVESPLGGPPCYSQNTVESPLGGPPCYSQNTVEPHLGSHLPVKAKIQWNLLWAVTSLLQLVSEGA